MDDDKNLGYYRDLIKSVESKTIEEGRSSNVRGTVHAEVLWRGYETNLEIDFLADYYPGSQATYDSPGDRESFEAEIVGIRRASGRPNIPPDLADLAQEWFESKEGQDRVADAIADKFQYGDEGPDYE